MIETKFRRPPARWVLPQKDPPAAAVIAEAFGLLPPVARILAARGFDTVESVGDFLSPRLDRLHDPFLMRGMQAAVDRIGRAIQTRERILIYGDYDVDGTTSVVILTKTIELLGGTSEFFIPHRVRDGYGMHENAIEAAAARGVTLIVSVDTGIRALEAVARASSCGIDVIVTDHHLPDCELPAAFAVINPNQPDCGYPCKHLCGAGVAFKLSQGLLSRSGLAGKRQNALLDSFLKPVAIATVADIVPLTDENRIIVRRGLSGMREVRNVGLRALLNVAGLSEGAPPSTHEVAFQLAPRINAAGRMSTASDVVELFLTSNAERAGEIAAQLDALNRERQQVEREIVETIVDRCERDEEQLNAAAMVFWAPDWHLGVLGIVASRLVERFCRPVFVLGTGTPGLNGEILLTGSGRSVPGFHLLEALESMSPLFSRHGGHRSAAGLTLPEAHAESFRIRFAAYAAERLTDDDRRPLLTADAAIALSEVNDHLAGQIFQLGPFGFGNAAPVLYCPGVEVAAEPRPLGEGGKHFSIAVRQNARTIFAKAWNFGDRAHLFARGSKLDLLLQIEEDGRSRQRGYASWKINIKDAAPSEGR